MTTDFDLDNDWPAFEAVQALFQMYQPPAGLVADLVEWEAYYTIRFYRDNFDKLTVMERHQSAEWLQKTIDLLSVIVPCYLEVWRRPGVPGQ